MRRSANINNKIRTTFKINNVESVLSKSQSETESLKSHISAFSADIEPFMEYLSSIKANES